MSKANEGEGKQTVNVAWSLNRTIDGLKYIAESPIEEYGGFHSNTVAIAKSALHHLREENVNNWTTP